MTELITSSNKISRNDQLNWLDIHCLEKHFKVQYSLTKLPVTKTYILKPRSNCVPIKSFFQNDVETLLLVQNST